MDGFGVAGNETEAESGLMERHLARVQVPTAPPTVETGAAGAEKCSDWERPAPKKAADARKRLGLGGAGAEEGGGRREGRASLAIGRESLRLGAAAANMAAAAIKILRLGGAGVEASPAGRGRAG